MQTWASKLLQLFLANPLNQVYTFNMNIVLGIAALIAFIGFLLFFGVFANIIHPIWALADCISSKTFTKKTKIIWGSLIVVLWSIGSAIYGLSVSKRRYFKWLSGIVLFSWVVLLGVTAFSIPYLIKEFQKEMNTSLSVIDLSDITEEQRTQIKNNLETLKNEMSIAWYEDLRKKFIARDLFRLLTLYLKDNKLEPAEYKDWIEKYNSRDVIDYSALAQFVANLKKSGTN